MIAKYPVIIKKYLPCLKCRRIIRTDKYHRFCRRCKRENEKISPRLRVFRMPSQTDVL